MKLSVAMITYNHERFIGQAIESVLAQKVNFDYEIVIGEDYSTDGTRKIILDLQKRHPDRIVALFRKRNVGAMQNFVETIAACHGQYLAMLEGDDYWIPANKLQKQVEFLDTHPDWAICCSRAEVRNESDMSRGYVRAHTGTIFPARPEGVQCNTQELSGLLPTIPRAAGTYGLSDLLCENFIPTCTVMYRWDGAGPTIPPSLYKSTLGDLPFHAIVAGSKKIELLDDCTAVYRIHPGGLWSTKDRRSQIRDHTQMLAMLNRHLEFPYNNMLGQTVARSYLELALAARGDRKRLETGQYVIACVRNGGCWKLPNTGRLLVGLAAYALIGSWYKAFSRVGPSSQVK